MENKDKIQIIKEILYEESTRKMLTSQQDAFAATGAEVKSRSIWKMLAVASLIALLSIIGFNYMNTSAVDRSALIAEVYEFPAINKSRGAQVNIVDDYIQEISSGKYKEVLATLPEVSISEKDQFYKASMYFVLNQHDKVKQILDNITWTDKYYEEESDWISFLMAYYSDDSSVSDMQNKLNATYAIKAEQLISSSK